MVERSQVDGASACGPCAEAMEFPSDDTAAAAAGRAAPEAAAAAAADAAPSRSRTVFLALKRLGLLDAGRQSLTLHIAGATWREEGGSSMQVFLVFTELLRGLDSEAEVSIDLLRLALVGPSCCAPSRESAGDTNPPQTPTASLSVGRCCLEVKHIPELYHDAHFDGPWDKPDAVFAFQPGLWGYAAWTPSVERILHQLRTPLVITSYNEEESDDDQGALEDMGLEVACWAPPGWIPELNPCASALPRPGTAGNRPRRDQHWWQCVVTPTAMGQDASNRE